MVSSRDTPVAATRTVPAAPLRVLRGRDAELERIGVLLDATARGRAGLLVVEGPPGSGKTALLTEVVAMARRTGVHSVSGGAGASRQTAPCGPLVDALCAGESPLWERTALRRLMVHPDPLYWLIEALHGAVEAAALKAPRVIVLDDLQWADRGTLAALRQLVPRLAHLPVLWVLACRTAQAQPELRDLLSLLASRDSRIPLRPLDTDAVAAIVADRLGAPGTSSLLTMVAGGCGNPSLLAALLDGLVEQGRVRFLGGRADVVGDLPPRRLVTVMNERLDRLSCEAQRVVRLAAVLGARIGAEPLAEMLDRRPSQIVDAIDEAMRADLLSSDGHELRFRHELLRDAVLETLPATVRTALLHEAAGVRLRHGAPPVDVVSEPDEHKEPSLARPSEGWESLTESELRVARLVAEGAKNREAAARLFLSPHTVSTHLRHCFAKLGINSRVELVRVALEYEPQRLS